MINPALERLAKPLSWFAHDAKNARRHNDRNLLAIAESLRSFGQQKPVVALKSGVVIAGNGTLEAARRLEWTHLAVVVFDDEEKARAYAIADNRTAELAEWDPAGLRASLSEISSQGINLSDVGFDDVDIRKFTVSGHERTKVTGVGEDDEAPKLSISETPASVLGEVYQLGPHRLMAGDATKPADIAKLMDGQTAHAVVTDPPYAMFGSSTGIAADITDDKMVRPFFRDVVVACTRVLQPFGHAYLCCDWRSYAAWWEVMRGTGMVPKNCIVWDKGAGLGSMFANAHEFMLFASFRPQRRHMRQKISGERMVNGINVWRINRAAGEETGGQREHNAQKPLTLFQRAMEHSTDPGQLVVDFFGGSGTAIIAADRCGRVCNMMELDLRYADLIRRRWTAWAVSKGKDPGPGRLE